jgi:hypothetical protein
LDFGNVVLRGVKQMAFDLSAFRMQPRPEEKLGMGGGMVDPHGGINPQPGAGMGMIPPPKGGFLGGMPGVGMPPQPMPQMPMPQTGGVDPAMTKVAGGLGAILGGAAKPPMPTIGATPPAINRPATRPNSFRSARRGRLGMF